ncbi:MAG TPA: hypothetical protein VII01_15595 [Solirubrobacteraceae bacterium]
MGISILADTPALPLHEAGKYVAGAYVVLFVILLIYVAIMALRLSRIERELGELLACAREGELPEQNTQEEPAALGRSERESTPA